MISDVALELSSYLFSKCTKEFIFLSTIIQKKVYCVIPNKYSSYGRSSGESIYTDINNTQFSIINGVVEKQHRVKTQSLNDQRPNQ